MEQEFLEKIEELIEVKNLSMDKRIQSDLFTNSLKFAKVIIELEEHYHIEFDDEELLVDNTSTLRDLYEVIQKKIAIQK